MTIIIFIPHNPLQLNKIPARTIQPIISRTAQSPPGHTRTIQPGDPCVGGEGQEHHRVQTGQECGEQHVHREAHVEQVHTEFSWFVSVQQHWEDLDEGTG